MDLQTLLSLGTRSSHGCLIFKGKRRNGYGVVQHNGKTVSVHRLIMHLKHGFDLNSPYLILHKNFICKSKLCFDDTHLYIGDHHDNKMDLINLNPLVTNCKTCGLPLEGDNLIKYYKSGRRCRNCARRQKREFSARQKQKKLLLKNP